MLPFTYSWAVFLYVGVFHRNSMANPSTCQAGSQVTARKFSQIIHNYNITGPVFSTITAENPRECEMECHLADPDVCSMFNYYPDTRVCELLYKDHPTEYKVKKKNGAMFKTRKCVNNRCRKGEQCCTVGEGKDNMYYCMCDSKICSRYSKLNTKPVCFGAKGESYGSFYIISDNATVVKFVLVHMSGGVSGAPHEDQGNWGSQRKDNRELQLYITDSQRRTIFPKSDIPIKTIWGLYSYNLPGRTVNNPELMLPDFSPPLDVVAGQEFQVWFGPDLYVTEDQDLTDENDNHGTSCCDVYAYYRLE